MAVADVIDSSRALQPQQSGFADVDGVRIAYEVFGEGEETLLLLPPWAINHSRFWKAQVPYLARHFRVVTFDPRGNGRSDRPDSPEAYGPRATEQDALAVLDAAGVEHCVLVVHCGPAPAGLLLANHADRVRGALFIAPALPLTPPVPERTGHSFEADLPVLRGLGAREPPLVGARLPRLPGVLLRLLLLRAALDEADRGRGRTGAWRRTARRWRARSTLPGSTRRPCTPCSRA